MLQHPHPREGQGIYANPNLLAAAFLHHLKDVIALRDGGRYVRNTWQAHIGSIRCILKGLFLDLYLGGEEHALLHQKRRGSLYQLYISSNTYVASTFGRQPPRRVLNAGPLYSQAAGAPRKAGHYERAL